MHRQNGFPGGQQYPGLGPGEGGMGPGGQFSPGGPAGPGGPGGPGGFPPYGGGPQQPPQGPPFAGGQIPPPPSPPPSGEGPGLYAVDPGSLYGCLYRYTWVRLNNGRRFWFYPVFIGRESVAGYRWRPNRRRWDYFGIDTRRIASFQCF
ncbi:hypothetical protein [Halobacillus sp. A5]|uniref:hypothetical protein n=1 Tax=Halobacillus sp. A5 TaxID=2880263 RepID=UPI0020A685D5|nr:hypothetical protein [Halobacillus sp. A5]MCP3026785.1 hypothetical protein [Halobacillus sp. A5]